MEKTYRLEELCPCVREAGLQRKDSWRTRPRRIYDHEFLYCFLGNAHFHIENREYDIGEGDVVIIPPDVAHTFWMDEKAAGELYWLQCDFEWRDDNDWLYDYYNTPEKYVHLFSGELTEWEHLRPRFRLEDGWTFPEKVSFAHNDHVDTIFRTIFKLYMRKDPRLPVQSKVLLLQLIELIMNETGRFAADTAARPRISDTVINYVEANYYRPLNVREICACTHLNPDYAGKLFKKETGMSLITYLNSYRINKAKRLLLDTDLNIADVSEMVGFQNENYFCSVSKKLTGATPARLRAYMLSTLDEEA